MKYAPRVLFCVLALSSMNAHSGWDCPSGQPAACIAEVEASNAVFRSNIAFYNKELTGADKKIADCWEQKKTAIENKNDTALKISKQNGRLEELEPKLSEEIKALKVQKDHLALMKAYQNEFQSFFRDVVVSLQDDIENGSLIEVSDLRKTLKTELSISTDESKAKVLRLTISILDEIIAAIEADTQSRSDLKSKLQKTANEVTDEKSKVTELARSAIKSSLTEEDFRSVNMNDKLSLLVIQTEASVEELKKKVKEDSFKVASVKNTIKSHSKTYEYYLNRENSLQKSCTEKQVFLTVTAPTELAKNTSYLSTNQNYLDTQQCRAKYCTYDRPVNRGDRN